MLVACWIVASCDDDQKHRAALDSLVHNSANEADVTKQLGAGVTVYERGTPSWVALQQFLAREPASNYQPLRQAVEKYHRVLYYTTEWRMTWLFRDEHGVVRGYFLSAQ